MTFRRAPPKAPSLVEPPHLLTPPMPPPPAAPTTPAATFSKSSGLQNSLIVTVSRLLVTSVTTTLEQGDISGRQSPASGSKGVLAGSGAVGSAWLAAAVTSVGAHLLVAAVSGEMDRSSTSGSRQSEADGLMVSGSSLGGASSGSEEDCGAGEGQPDELELRAS